MVQGQERASHTSRAAGSAKAVVIVLGEELEPGGGHFQRRELVGQLAGNGSQTRVFLPHAGDLRLELEDVDGALRHPPVMEHGEQEGKQQDASEQTDDGRQGYGQGIRPGALLTGTSDDQGVGFAGLEHCRLL